MNPNIHERARHLIDVLHVEGIAAPERQWLEAHLSECEACQVRASANEQVLQALQFKHRDDYPWTGQHNASPSPAAGS